MFATEKRRQAVAALLFAVVLVAPRDVRAQGLEPIGDFYFSQRHDPYTNEAHDILFTISFEQSTVQGVLGWKCDSTSGLYVNLSFGKYLSGGNEARIRARVDSEPMIDMSACPMLQSHKGVMLQMDRVQELTEAAKRGNRLTIDVGDDLASAPLTYIFSLKGLTRGLERLACGRVGGEP